MTAWSWRATPSAKGWWSRKRRERPPDRVGARHHPPPRTSEPPRRAGLLFDDHRGHVREGRGGPVKVRRRAAVSGHRFRSTTTGGSAHQDGQRKLSPPDRCAIRADGRHVVVGSTVEHSAGQVLPHAAPLFEEKADPGVTALSANRLDPRSPHGPGAGARFTADDHPIDAGQRQAGKRTEKGLQGKEFDPGPCRLQMLHSKGVLRILNTDAHPQVDRPI